MPKASVRPKLAIAGATGFIGSALRDALQGDYDIIGLTRSPTRAALPDEETTWRQCDLFSLLQLEEALTGVDVAIYLVHSMLPSARLTQGTFSDLDMILADNFARAAESCGVKQIVYLSGLLPEDTSELSAHLQSRYEVELTLASHNVPVTTLRAGLVVGPGGSSLKILVNLVRRLPAMVLPKWTNTLTQPIALVDVVRAFHHVLCNPACFGKTYDIAGPDVMTYRQMMEQTAEVMDLDRPMVGVPVITPALSTLWVSLVSGSSQDLAGPLIDSLRHDLVAQDNPLLDELEPEALSFVESLRQSITDDNLLLPNPRKTLRSPDDAIIKENRLVRSVQRLELPAGRSAFWAANEYFRWLPTMAGPFIRVHVEDLGGDEEVATFYVRPYPKPVLVLTYSPDRSTADRALFYVTDGALLDKSSPHVGRLEFREVLDGQYLIAAIHDFAPRLPWRFYRSTQAVAHLIVMRQFGRHLQSVG